MYILTWTGNILFHIQLFYLLNYIHLLYSYVGVIRTPNSKYQKFMTYRLVHNIFDKKKQSCKKSVLILNSRDPCKLVDPFKVNPTRTDKIKNQIVLSYSCLPIPSLPFYFLSKTNARDKIWTYNLNIFRVPLYQIELLELIYIKNKSVEILGLDPKITICKIAVLPVKLYPLFSIKQRTFFFNPLGIRTQGITVKASCLNRLTSGSGATYPKNDLNVYNIISINLKFILSTNSSTRM